MKAHEEQLAKTLLLRRLRMERERSTPKSRKPPPRKQAKLWGLYEELTFGKHVGRTIDYVIEHDRGWITYMLENASNFELAPAAQAEYEAAADPRRGPRSWE